MVNAVLVLVLMGSAGCGKSTVAQELVKILKCPYIEGDTLHSQVNIEKMSSGIPLKDADRWPWLYSIKQHIMEVIDELPSNNTITVTCSALKKSYRDVLRSIPSNKANVVFVYLKGSFEVLLKRLHERRDHFVTEDLLQSQLDTLEEPPEEEDVIVCDINQSPRTQAYHIVEMAVKTGYLPTSLF